MQLFVTYIVLFVTAVKARSSDFYFFIADPMPSEDPVYMFSNITASLKL